MTNVGKFFDYPEYFGKLECDVSIGLLFSKKRVAESLVVLSSIGAL